MKERILREVELKEQGIEELLGNRETLEYDLEEDISLMAKELIRNRIREIDSDIWCLKVGIRSIEKRLMRQYRR